MARYDSTNGSNVGSSLRLPCSVRHTFTIVVASALIGAICGAVVATILTSGNETSREQLDVVVGSAVDAALEQAVDQAVDQAMQQSTSELAAQLEDSANAQRARIAGIYEQISQSVVIIDAEGPERTNDEGVVVIPAALATGFVLDADGHIITAAHVLEGMSRFMVILPTGETLVAERLGDDIPFSDVAVLRIESDELQEDLVVPSFGSSVALRAGETVVAFGNTILGKEIAISVGIVSDPDTTFFRERYEQDNLIQTDAALNHGNSGGVLVDLDGDIVGMTAVIARETRDGEFVDGVGFAIQIDAVLEVAREIAENGFYPRPTFGVVNERLLTPTAAAQLDLEVTEGSFLIEIQRLGAFARAGIRPGDVLRELNGIAINADTPYLNALATLEPNVPVIVHIHRGGEDYRLSVTPDLRAP
ncbi:MAG: trypsin-like serine protease [Chloroflexi bacterium]|nr:trypsin-like serine protease [Chloroflexota bacterium]MYJ91929.1 trypsin-like serine protease [Chloroflexota bacterium]